MTPLLSQPRVAVPRSWRRTSDPTQGVLLAARPPTVPASGVPPEIVLRLAPDVLDDLETWRARALRELADHLTAFAFEDDDLYELDGRLVLYARFAHLLGTADVVCEQWSWLVDTTGVTLSCSVAREDYADYGDVFEDLAGTVEFPERVA